MCGICGEIYFKDKNRTAIGVNAMIKAIKHRGPDGEGLYQDENIKLGHVRLSIIDVTDNASQPMISQDRKFVIVLNGEIYNYQKIKKQLVPKYNFTSNSDTEVLLNAYREWGEDCLEKLSGMFSFVIYDKENSKIFGARDRLGIKPFFYYKNKEKFLFASEIKAILTDDTIERGINEEMLYDFLVFNRTSHSEQTLFKNIYNLRPGHRFKLDILTGEFRIGRWYKLPKINDTPTRKVDYKGHLLSLLKESIYLHMVGDVPIGLTLSGGLDSSTVASLMNEGRRTSGKLCSFSAVYSDLWKKDEKKYIEIVKDYLGLDAIYVKPSADNLYKDLDKLIYHQEEPFANASIFAGWSVYSCVHDHNMKVVLNGQGSDEIFGYDYMAAFYFYELFKSFQINSLLREMYWFMRKQKFGAIFTIKLFIFLLSPKVVRNLLMRKSSPMVSKDFYSKYRDKTKFFSKFFNIKSLNESVRNHLLYKLNHLLRVDDKNAMAFSVESRVPFLEKDLVEYVMNIPPELKVCKGESKYILKECMRDLLPNQILERNDKIGFETPMDEWFRSDKFISLIDKLLRSNRQPMSKYLDIDYIKRKWFDHKNGKGNNGQIIWKYLFLTRWYDIFISKA